jgi:DinB superfamily
MPGIMSRGDDLRQARDRMEAVRAEIYATVSGKSDAELLCPPAGGGWSAGEVLDHLRAAEGSLVRALTKFEKGEPTRVPKVAWWYRVPMSPLFWHIRFTAPKLVRPRPRAEVNPGEVLEALRTSRRDLLALADRMGEERFAAMIFPHFLLGRFSGVTWFQFIGKHETRHLAQIRRVLAGPKVLRCAPASRRLA